MLAKRWKGVKEQDCFFLRKGADAMKAGIGNAHFPLKKQLPPSC